MNYIGITIGPLYETITTSLFGDSKTKKLKSASYFFSLFMKSILHKIYEKVEIVSPYVDNDIFNDKDLKKYGYFHDRIIAKSSKNIKELEDLITKAIDEVFNEFEEKFDLNKERLKKYLLLKTKIINSKDLEKINSNKIFAINRILDSLELDRTIPNNFKRDKVIKSEIEPFQEWYIKKRKVKSMEDIAGEEKYVAVVVADGDKMGKLVEKYQDDLKDTLSKKLYEFLKNIDGKDIYEFTNIYKGELIYAGGDDILALVNANKVLDYIRVIQKEFTSQIDTTLSFGINIVYYKYPLREAINEAFSLLYKAKEKKGAFCIRVNKHSGQYFEFTQQFFNKNQNSFKERFNKFISFFDKKYPKSFHHSLREYEKLIYSILEKKLPLKSAFENLFNELSNEEKSNILEIADYIQQYVDVDSFEKDFNNIFSELSFIKFLDSLRIKNETNNF